MNKLLFLIIFFIGVSYNAKSQNCTDEYFMHYIDKISNVLSTTDSSFAICEVSLGSDFDEFVKATLNDDVLYGIRDRLLKFGDQLYLMPAGMPSVKGMKVLRPGLHLGTLKKNRFEPSHALALALKPDQVKHTMELYTEDNDNMANAYLNGMTLNHEGEKGWYLMTYRGYSIGWGKLAGQIMKNHYPKGLRK